MRVAEQTQAAALLVPLRCPAVRPLGPTCHHPGGKGRPPASGGLQKMWQNPPPPQGRVLPKPNMNFKRRGVRVQVAASEQPQAFAALRINTQSRGSVDISDLDDPSLECSLVLCHILTSGQRDTHGQEFLCMERLRKKSLL